MLRDLLAGRTREQTPGQGVAPRRAAARAARLAAGPEARRPGRARGRAVAASVDPGADRRRARRRRRRPRRRPPAARHRHRPLRRPRRQGELLPARAQAPARGLDPAARAVRRPPGPPVVAPARSAAVAADDPVARTAFALGRRTPTRPAARPGRDLRRRHARAAAAAAEDRPRLGRAPPTRATPAPRPRRTGRKGRFGNENEDEAHVRVWGPRRPAVACCSSSSRCPARSTPARTPGSVRWPAGCGCPILERSALMTDAMAALRPARRAARPAPPCSRRAPAPARPSPSARWWPATSPRARAALDEMLVITFGRAASQELRERVRDQLVEAERALADPAAARALGRPGRAARRASTTPRSPLRRKRLRDALADFDAATIATTHQFCQLGAALARRRRRHRLRRRAGRRPRRPGRRGRRRRLPRALRPARRGAAVQARRRARARPRGGRRPAGRAAPRPTPAPGTPAHGAGSTSPRRCAPRSSGASAASASCRYDDLLTRLADALEAPTTPRPASGCASAGRSCWSTSSRTPTRCSGRCSTAPSPAHATMVLIGDPKQAIYAFRGGDIFTYLAGGRHRRDPADAGHQLAQRRAARRRAAGAARRRRARRPADRRTPGRGAPRRAAASPGAPGAAPAAAAACCRGGFRPATRARCRSTGVRAHIAAGPRRRRRPAARLRAPRSTADPVGAGDVAVLIYSLKHVGLFQRGARRPRHPVGGQRRQQRAAHRGGRRLAGPARGAGAAAPLGAGPRRSRSPRSSGSPPSELDAGGDDLTDDVAERVRRWLDLLRGRGIAAVHEAIIADGLAARVLARPDGERLLTDLDHLGQVLHEVAAPRAPRPARAAGLAARRASRRPRPATSAPVASTPTRGPCSSSRSTPARACSTPSSTCRSLFDKWVAGRRRPRSSTTSAAAHASTSAAQGAGSTARGRPGTRLAGEELRLTYVALTRAQSPGGHLVGADLERRQRRADPAAVRPRARRGRGARLASPRSRRLRGRSPR